MMKNAIVMALMACLLLIGVQPAIAGGGHSHSSTSVSGSIWIGGAWGPYWGTYPYYPYSYPYPYYYPYYPPQPPVVIERETTPVFVAPAEKQESDYWYYCEESKAYYPYVKRCPGGWEKVRPVPDSEKE